MIKKLLFSIILVLSATLVFAIEPGVKGHKTGDIIAAKNDDEIAKWCNFEKQIVITQFNVLCVYKGPTNVSNDF